MKKYHINPETGNPGLCNPQKTGVCKYGDSEHYLTPEAAQAAYETSNADEIFAPVRKNQTGELSATMSALYARWSLMNDHLHCSSAIGNEGELYYYSSPVGQLELALRMSSETPGYAPHRQIAEKLKTAPEPQLVLTREQEENFARLAQAGALKLQERAKESNGVLDTSEHKDLALGAYLVEKSEEWLSHLTPKEQHALSYATSAGFYMVEAALDSEEVTKGTIQAVTRFYPKETAKFRANIAKMRPSEKRTALEVDFYYGRAKAYARTLKTALKKAPKLEEPIKTYRGVKPKEFVAEFGHEDETAHELKDRLLSGELDGRILGKRGSETLAPKFSSSVVSTSVNPKRALGFSRAAYNGDEPSLRIVYEIEAFTMASPVNVSAWSSGEAEVYSNPNSKYELVETVLTTEGSDDKELLVVKLRELP